MSGYKTYTGIAVIALGIILEGYANEGEVQELVSILAQFVGIGLAIYGRYKATK
jgi:hypothetical protein